jgi:WD40 repeat protein
LRTPIVFAPDGKVLASRQGNQVLLWDAATGQNIRSHPGHSWQAEAFAFSADGKTLASVVERREPTISLWNVATGGEIRTLEATAPTKLAAPLAFSPDGRILASGAEWPEDRTISLWEVSRGKLLTQLRGHGGGVLSVAFAPDGKTLASGSADTTVLLWDVSRWQQAERPR